VAWELDAIGEGPSNAWYHRSTFTTLAIYRWIIIIIIIIVVLLDFAIPDVKEKSFFPIYFFVIYKKNSMKSVYPYNSLISVKLVKVLR
jgi:hypothetical protein